MTETPHNPPPGREADPYKVQLDVFNGPLDLLLYLIRRDEIDIYDIPIAHIAEEYLKFVDVLKNVDVDYASDFLVMAATLMEIKSRMLLPRTGPLDDEDDANEDPRANLIRELVEYREFRQRADHLRDLANEASRRFPRQIRRIIGPDGAELELEEVNIWQLMDAFNTVLRQTMAAVPQAIVYDDTPMERVMEDIEWRIAEIGSLRFGDLLADRGSRAVVISYFLGILELTRMKKIRIMQEVDGGEIYITLRTDRAEPEPPAEPDTAPAAPEAAPAGGRVPADNDATSISNIANEDDGDSDALDAIAPASDLPPEFDLPDTPEQ